MTQAPLYHLDYGSSPLPGLSTPPVFCSLFPTQSKGACEHLNQTRTLLAQSPPLAPTPLCQKTGHSSVSMLNCAPFHLSVGTCCALFLQYSFPSSVNSSYSPGLCSGITSSRRSSWTSLIGQVPQYRLSQLCDLLYGPHVSDISYLFL